MMSLTCKIIGSFLLVFSLSTKGENSRGRRVIWGPLDHDINLDLSGFQKSDGIEHVRWDKGRTLAAELRNDYATFQLHERYEILTNRTLKIKHLKRNDSDIYSVHIYDTHGKRVFQEEFDLKILEMVSTPRISWNCSNTTLTCEVTKGTELELTLYQNGKRVGSNHQTVIRHRWINTNDPFKCMANNSVSKEYSMAMVSCSERGLRIHLIVGTCAGGLLLLVFVALLIVYISKRKKQSRQRNGEEPERKASRMTQGEKRPKLHPIPAAAPRDTAAPQAPPPPGHCPQGPGHVPLPASHRVQHQQKRRPPPPGTQLYQQKGPPLPRPRAQPKPPCGVAEGAPPPSPN